jgi:O-antigen/teichoic acid export membrane protein
MIMSLATTGFASAWFPYFQSFAQRQDDVGPAFSRVLLACTGCLGAATVMFYAATPLVATAFGDPRYAGATRFVGDVALVQAMLGVWGVLVPVLYFRDRIWIASAIQGIGATIALVATFALVQFGGADAAALGAVAGVAAMIGTQLMVNRHLGTPAGTFPSWSHAALATAVVAAIVVARNVATAVAALPSLFAGTVLALALLGSSIAAIRSQQKK